MGMIAKGRDTSVALETFLPAQEGYGDVFYSLLFSKHD